MIIFDLTCEEDHPFEGWFQSSESFEQQLISGLISCPHCGSIDIHRLPSIVHVAHSEKPTQSVSKATDSALTSEMLSVYQQLVSSIISSSDDVGNEFAEEARKIHYMDAPLRSIHGEVSAEEFQSLFEEGIDVLRLPVVPKKKNLN